MGGGARTGSAQTGNKSARGKEVPSAELEHSLIDMSTQETKRANLGSREQARCVRFWHTSPDTASQRQRRAQPAVESSEVQ